MSAAEEDERNAIAIAKALNGKQNNCHPIGEIGPMREVWNLSDFGFAFEITKAVPARHLRIRGLKRLIEMTKNNFVIDQIEEYLSDDKKHDSAVADRLAFDLRKE